MPLICIIVIKFRLIFLQNLRDDFKDKKPVLARIHDEFPRLLKEQGIKVQPVEERFEKVKVDFEETENKLIDYEETVLKETDTAERFNNAVNELKQWLPEVTELPIVKEPIGCNPETVLRQLEELKVG